MSIRAPSAHTDFRQIRHRIRGGSHSSDSHDMTASDAESCTRSVATPSTAPIKSCFSIILFALMRLSAQLLKAIGKRRLSRLSGVCIFPLAVGRRGRPRPCKTRRTSPPKNVKVRSDQTNSTLDRVHLYSDDDCSLRRSTRARYAAGGHSPLEHRGDEAGKAELASACWVSYPSYRFGKL